MDEAEAWSQKAYEQFVAGDFVGAIAAYDQALQLKPDWPEVWNNKGACLTGLERYEEAIADLEHAIRLKPDSPNPWVCKGECLRRLERYEEAIAVYDQALQLKPDWFEVWAYKGYCLTNIGRYEEAIVAYDQLLQLKPGSSEGWNDKGVCLRQLEQYEDAIAALEHAIQLTPDSPKSWANKGDCLFELERYEEAIVAYDQALQLKLDWPQVWANKGSGLLKLERYEEAIVAYDQTIKLKPDWPEIWNNKGVCLLKLERYEEAIAAYNQALHYNPKMCDAWINRGTALCRLNSSNFTNVSLVDQIQRQTLGGSTQKSHIEALREALPHISTDTPGFGHIHLALGDAHLKHSLVDNPRPYWRDAKRSYHLAAKNLPESQFPNEHLRAIWGICQTSLFLEEDKPHVIDALLRKGTDLRLSIIETAPPAQQEQLNRELPNFNELTVDLLLRQGHPVRALETAEADKNGLMQWLLGTADSPTYADMRAYLQTVPSPSASLIYWHLSANALTTFILEPNQPDPLVLHQSDRPTALAQRQKLTQWIKNWDCTYADHQKNSKAEPPNQSTWQATLETQLHQLAEILDISAIAPHLPADADLILIPHRDLHRMPLHTLFPGHRSITYLPSVRMGQKLSNLQAIAPSDSIPHLLLIEAPDHEGMSPLYHAAFEAIALRSLYPNSSHIAPHQAKPDPVAAALARPHTYLHYNGHAYHHPTNPKQSAIALMGTATLTLQAFLHTPFHPSQIVSLAACETGLTSSQSSTAEYVGWVSAFLSRGVPHVLSTLWTVESAATALFTFQFYRRLQRHSSAHAAYRYAQYWLRTLTVRKLIRLYQTALPYQSGSARAFLKTELRQLGKMESQFRRYAHPYYWAAFILSGRPESS